MGWIVSFTPRLLYRPQLRERLDGPVWALWKDDELLASGGN